MCNLHVSLLLFRKKPTNESFVECFKSAESPDLFSPISMAILLKKKINLSQYEQYVLPAYSILPEVSWPTHPHAKCKQSPVHTAVKL